MVIGGVVSAVDICSLTHMLTDITKDHRIHEYLCWDLTYDNDGLNAFEGILPTSADKRPVSTTC